jgi:glycine/D-amino acid oxidase-like deaminating enzyme/nitrite reductase/ring-hydroxylating ferredoxin subunit
MMDPTITSGLTQPLWLNDFKTNSYPPLSQDVHTEVCIIGAGIAGLTTAYCLLQAGLKVVVIDDGQIGSGETGRTTAHLSNALDDHYCNIIKVHGLDKARLAAQSHADAINFIEQLIKQENIDCDFIRLDGYLFTSAENPEHELLNQELAAASAVGLRVELLEEPFDECPFMDKRLKFKQQAQFHPMKYLDSLAKLIVAKGGLIYEKTHAAEINDANQTWVKTSTGYKIIAQSIVQATNVPINTNLAFHSKQEPNRTYVIVAKIHKNSLTPALYWDTVDPYHYIRIQKGEGETEDYLIVGGEDHRTGFIPEQDPFAALIEWTQRHFPQVIEIAYRWSGQIIEPVDFLSFIGRNVNGMQNTYIVTGDSGNGITHGTLAAIHLAKLITKQAAPWQEVYDPSRLILQPIKDMLQHNFDTVSGYLKYVTPGEIQDSNQLKPGTGAILREGVKKVAVYRNLTGDIKIFSASCPHKKAILSWNPIESSWDCSAHGSRFSADGEVINGPAICNMECLGKEENN